MNFEGRITKKGFIGPIIKVPFRAQVVGQSGAGKSHLTEKLLTTEGIFSEKNWHCITYYYGETKPNIPNPKIKYKNSLPEDIVSHDGRNCLIILDDLLSECSDSEVILNVFLKKSRHCRKSVILLSQNLFYPGKYSRTISLNTEYFIIFKSPRDSSQISYLARQIFPQNPNFLRDAYLEITKNTPHSYIFISLKQCTGDQYRVWGDITSDQPILLTSTDWDSEEVRQIH